MKYFSIDYRSPPSGMGQIIDTKQPEKIGDQYNYILITYSGCGSENDPSYNLTKHFHTQEAYQGGWPGPITRSDIFQYLRDQGVTHVHDGELAYEYEGGNQEDIHGLFTLDRWIEIMFKLI